MELKDFSKSEENVCKICEEKPSKYVCPKCNILYCSLNCYQSIKHIECSEKFYEALVKEEIRSRKTNEEMLDDISDIIKRVNEQFSSDIDSDDEENIDLSERLKDVDLNDANTVWTKLTQTEQQEFEALVSSGEISKCVPVFIPWWEENVKKIQEIGVDVVIEEKDPKILKNIKPFHLLTRVPPSPCVKCNIVNIIAAYTFVVRYFNGDHFDYTKEAVYVLTTLSRNILLNFNFESYVMAVESVHQQSLQNDWVFTTPDTIETIRSDVKSILRNSHSQNSYILRALSDIRNLLDASKEQRNKQKEFSKRFAESFIPPERVVSKSNVQKCILKIDYYLSYMQNITSALNVVDFVV